MSTGRTTLKLADLQNLYWSTERTEKELLPLVLYRGPTTLGYYQGIWNTAQALKAVEVETCAEAGRFVAENPDLAHAAGVHLTKSDMQGAFSEKLWRLTNRIHSSQALCKADPELAEYLRHVMHNSRRMVITTLRPIPRYSPWSKQAWRRPIPTPDEPVNPAWPFLPVNGTRNQMDGADILMAVDRLVPAGLPRQIRDDVCQDMVLAVLEGTVTLDGLADDAPAFIKSMWKKFPIKWGHLSLDQPAPWEDQNGRTLGERLVSTYAV